jgi:hypothetical protein
VVLNREVSLLRFSSETYSRLPLKGDHQRKTVIAFLLENDNNASSKNLPLTFLCMYGKKFVGGGWSDQVNSSQSEREMVGGSGGEAFSLKGSWYEPLRPIPDASTRTSFTP